MNQNSFWAVILSLGLVVSAYFISSSINSFSESKQTLEVTGSAKRKINSDIGIIRLEVKAEAQSLKEAYQLSATNFNKVQDYLKTNGFTNIEVFPANANPVYKVSNTGYQTSEITHYVSYRNLEVSSNEVNKIKELALNIPKLAEDGLGVSAEYTRYLNTKLSEIKIEMQAEAAKNARQRAEKIAESTEAKLGKIVGAKMGVIQITPVNSTDVSDYGVNDNSSIEKEITTVVNLTFALK